MEIDLLDDMLQRICQQLALSAAKHDEAEERYHAVGDWLLAEGSPLVQWKPVIYPQGSLLLGTTVRPRGRNEFDLDLVCEFLGLNPHGIENPVVLLDLLEARLKANRLYAPNVRRLNRCIRLVYQDLFHMDLLPACPDRNAAPQAIVVPDRKLELWKASNPKGFAAWFSQRARSFTLKRSAQIEPLPTQSDVSDLLPLVVVVQLLKRWRDHWYAKDVGVAPISIVLTTLAARHYGGGKSVASSLTETLRSISDAIPSGERLVVLNPANEKEDLSEKWNDPELYKWFLIGIRSLRKSWEEVVAAQGAGIPALVAALNPIFGEEVVKPALVAQSEAIQKRRQAPGLRVAGSTGGLVISGGATRPIPKHTFYGD